LAQVDRRLFNTLGFRNSNLGFRLIREVDKPGHLIVKINEPALILLNDRPLGKAAPGNPLVVPNLSAGEYSISARAAGFTSQNERAEIKVGTVAELSLFLGRGFERQVAGKRFGLFADGTLSDPQTGLTWMRCSLGQTWDGKTCRGDGIPMTWKDALEQSGDGFAGYDDWRLPTVDELKTIVYCSTSQPKAWNETGTKCQGSFTRPTIDVSLFPGTPSGGFWSSSPHVDDSSHAWYVGFGGGVVYSYVRDGQFYARLVRGGE
jgi:hypothetical protein